MNILNNRNKRTSIFKAVALCLIAAMSFTLVSCDDDMDIQQSYPFTVEVMPVPNKVVKGQTVEIRCELKKEGDFSGTLYTIRYFQFEGDLIGLRTKSFSKFTHVFPLLQVCR